MAFSLPLSKAARKLSEKCPTASILGPHTLSSACGVLAINVLFLVIGLAVLFKQDWYQCRCDLQACLLNLLMTRLIFKMIESSSS